MMVQKVNFIYKFTKRQSASFSTKWYSNLAEAKTHNSDS